MTTAEAADDDVEIPDDVIAALSDYLDGTLGEAARADVDRKLADDPLWQRAHAELQETRRAVSTLRKARAPETFDQNVTSTIHKRSAGRFFGRRTLGDRVPFGVLLVLALAALVAIAIVLRSSQTGSLKPNPKDRPPPAVDRLLDHD